MYLALVLVVVLATLRPSFSSEDVAKDFDAAVLTNEHVTAVKFYSSMCGSCKDFAPIWDEFEAAMKGHLTFGVVDIDKPAGMKLASDMG